MNISLQAYTDELRRRLGNPTVDELSAEVLADSVDAALRDYSKQRPANPQRLVITLQPNQEEYALPTAGTPPKPPDIVLDVVPAAPTTASARAFGQEFRALELDLVTFQITDLLALQYKVSQYREMFEQIEWNYNNPPIVFVSPSPVQALQAIVECGDFHKLETVPNADYETIMEGAKAAAFYAWANARDSHIVMVAPSSVGNIELVNGDKLREAAKVSRDLFEKRVGWNRPYIGQG